MKLIHPIQVVSKTQHHGIERDLLIITILIKAKFRNISTMQMGVPWDCFYLSSNDDTDPNPDPNRPRDGKFYSPCQLRWGYASLLRAVRVG